MSALLPFNPSYGQGQVVAPGAASASVSLRKGDKQVMLTNQGVNLCYVRIAAGNASTADYCVMAGQQVTLTKADDDVTLSHISALGTTLHIITGNGW